MDIKEKFQKAYKKIKQANNILIVTHERPDGDGLASGCALALLANKLSKKYSMYCHDKTPALLNFIPNIDKITNKKTFDWYNFDLIIIIDCGAISRTRLEEEIRSKNSNQYIIEFDHHPAVDDYADLEIRLPDMSSTAEILFHFFKNNNLAFDKQIATCILTGILTDTINFLNPSTTADTIAISSEMLSSGAQMPRINRFTWKNKNIHSMKALGNILDKLKINNQYAFAFCCLTYDEMASLNEEEETFDSVMNFLTNIDNVKAIMLLREEEPGKIKGSLRTNYPNIDISRLAKHLNGGGHAKASGFRVGGKIIKTENSWRII